MEYEVEIIEEVSDEEISADVEYWQDYEIRTWRAESPDFFD